MIISSPYLSSGQQLGETRQAMTKTLMKDIEKCISDHKDNERFYILVHAIPWPKNPNIIKIKLIPTNAKPPMMLSCMLFEVNTKQGKLTLNWSLPGNWPTWSVEGTNEPVPEVIASIDALGVHYDV